VQVTVREVVRRRSDHMIEEYARDSPCVDFAPGLVDGAVGDSSHG
jgi:hypothetical protein